MDLSSGQYIVLSDCGDARNKLCFVCSFNRTESPHFALLFFLYVTTIYWGFWCIEAVDFYRGKLRGPKRMSTIFTSLDWAINLLVNQRLWLRINWSKSIDSCIRGKRVEVWQCCNFLLTQLLLGLSKMPATCVLLSTTRKDDKTQTCYWSGTHFWCRARIMARHAFGSPPQRETQPHIGKAWCAKEISIRSKWQSIWRLPTSWAELTRLDGQLDWLILRDLYFSLC